MMLGRNGRYPARERFFSVGASRQTAEMWRKRDQALGSPVWAKRSGVGVYGARFVRMWAMRWLDRLIRGCEQGDANHQPTGAQRA